VKKITILIPAYNEEAVLKKLFQRLFSLADNNKTYQFEFFFVSDGSKDQTLSIIKQFAKDDSRISYINLARNYGKEIAMAAGFDHIDSDAVVIIDADLQDPPELIPEMIKYWEKGYDDVYAKRRSRSGESWLKKLTSKAYYRLLQKITRVSIQEDTGDFRLLDRRAVEAVKQFRESQRNTKAIFSLIGFKKKEVLYDRDPRIAGETHWNYLDLIKLAIDGITSFTTMPLRISTVIGIFVSGLSFIYLIYLVVRTIIFGIDLAGYASMMAVILFLGGIQLISIGIIGEYVGRIFNETKKRPLYFIEEYHHDGKTTKEIR
jgi:glycosyltransferase involved in cell wall biosynthesis